MSNMSDPQRFKHVLELFDARNSADPRLETVDGRSVPKELLYAERMTEMLQRFAPDANEVVRLACRAQHIQRWAIPRADYPMTSEGYQLWRTTLYKFHAETAGELMREAGYDDELIDSVKKVVSKRGLKVNPNTQMMEDVADLVFIEHYMLAFAATKPDYDEEKWLGIIRKTWKKMSARAQAFATSGKINLPEPLVPLILKAINS